MTSNNLFAYLTASLLAPLGYVLIYLSLPVAVLAKKFPTFRLPYFFLSGAIISIIVVWIAKAIFSWYGELLPPLMVIILIILVCQNNFRRISKAKNGTNYLAVLQYSLNERYEARPIIKQEWISAAGDLAGLIIGGFFFI